MIQYTKRLVRLVFRGLQKTRQIDSWCPNVYSFKELLYLSILLFSPKKRKTFKKLIYETTVWIVQE